MMPKKRIVPVFIPHRGCPYQCVFCDQRRVTGADPAGPETVTAALAGLEGTGYELAFYGGSFTALPREEQIRLLDAAAPFLRDGVLRCLRVSTRPDAVDRAGLELLRQKGVETVELGAQSMDDGVLERCGRGHCAADTVQAAALVREAGLSLVLQMMTGLPGSNDALDLETGRRLSALGPQGVRIYPTVILRDTPLYDLWRSGAYQEHTVDDAVRVCAGLWRIFAAEEIPIIRLGLNPTDALTRGGAVGGAYHPALGELVVGRVYLETARTLLRASRPPPDVTLGVCKSEISKMVGQHRCNLISLQREFSLRSIRVVPVPVPVGQVRVVCAFGQA